MVEPYLALREDLQRGAYASYVAELVDRFTETGDDDLGDLFELLAVTLQRLCDEDDPRLTVRYYEMRLLDALGFRPELSECVVSREPIQPQDQFFSYAGGGVVSPAHLHRIESAVKIPLATLKLLRHMQRSPYPRVKSLRIATALHDDVERIMLGYITHLLERKLQSVAFIRRIRHEI